MIKPNTKLACFPDLHNFHVAVIVGDHIIAGMALEQDRLGMWILEFWNLLSSNHLWYHPNMGMGQNPGTYVNPKS